jgi:hypothetical protein
MTPYDLQPWHKIALAVGAALGGLAVLAMWGTMLVIMVDYLT